MAPLDSDAAAIAPAGQPHDKTASSADGQSGAGVVRADGEATRRRPWLHLFIFALAFVVALGGVVAGNIFLAPILFHPGYKQRVAETWASGQNFATFDLNVDIRALRRNHIPLMPKAPELVVLGASHWQEASADLIPGIDYYNAHVHRDYYEDLLAVAELLVRHDRLPDTIMITIRDQTFRPVDQRTDALWLFIGPEYQDMAHRLGIPALSHFETMPLSDYVDLTSLILLRDKVVQWNEAPTLPGPTTEEKLDTLDILMPDGSVRWSREHDAMFTPERTRRIVDQAVADLRDQTIVFDPAGLEAVERLVSFLRQKGVNVVLTHPPFNPMFYDGIAGSEYARGLERVEAETVRIAEEHGATVVGSFSPHELGCTADQYIDIEHSNPQCLKRWLSLVAPLVGAPRG